MIPVVLQDVQFYDLLELQENAKMQFKINILRTTGTFEITLDNKMMCTGIINAIESTMIHSTNISVDNGINNLEDLNQGDIYSDLSLRGYNYCGLFRSLNTINISGKNGSIKWNNNWTTYLDCMLQAYVFDKNGVLILNNLEKVVINPNAFHEFTSEICK